MRRRQNRSELRIQLDPQGPAVTCIRVRRGVVVLDYRDAAGIRRTPSFGSKDEEESWIKAKRARARLRYLDEEDGEILFEDAWAMWLEEMREAVDATSHERYEDSGRYFLPVFTGVRLAKIRRRRIKAFILDKLSEKKRDGVTPRYARITVRKRMLGVLANFMQWAVDEEMLLSNPARELGRRLFRRNKGEEPARRRSMTTDQMVKWTAALESLVDGRTYLGLMLMLDTGFRLGEMVGLRVEDLDFDGGQIHVRRQVRGSKAGAVVALPKSKSSLRTIEMSARIKEHAQAELRHRAERAMKKGRPPCQWIAWEFSEVPTRGESDTARKHYQRAMKKLCAAAGIGRFTPHALRHTWGTIQADHGAGQKALQSWYGHASPAQTAEYVDSARPSLGPRPDQEPAGPDLLAKLAEGRRPRGVAAFASAGTTSKPDPS